MWRRNHNQLITITLRRIDPQLLSRQSQLPSSTGKQRQFSEGEHILVELDTSEVTSWKEDTIELSLHQSSLALLNKKHDLHSRVLKKDEEMPKAMSELDECQIDVKEEELENHSTALQVFSTSDGTLHPNSFNMISNGISQDQLPFMSFPQPFVAHVEVLKCEGEPAVVRVLANRTLDVLTQLSSHWILVDSSGSICLKLDQNLNETGLTTQQLANRKKMREEDRRWSVPEQIEEEDRSHKKDEKELQAVPIDAQKASVFRLGLVLWDLGL
ncbi:hypothetical protein BLNAU_5080 [Blattamonas nauphoetae]|uniref:Uncharacterized protein n=1 Tax=Blattamonas nauphoetae TaxID=2049346 RepID=A0ABQ9XVN2_9EUKA|nr:hypothetical protein BLNAU_9587 [Blattamonas nauphoetae]KAK2959883.1 hypothetical protein BLNAU_5080 [Blattamonas nauphoetae]